MGGILIATLLGATLQGPRALEWEKSDLTEASVLSCAVAFKGVEIKTMEIDLMEQWKVDMVSYISLFWPILEVILLFKLKKKE